ncbi:ecotropic viral integration site 5 protein homolog isoform X2 [Hippocampus comes]|uniref:ecotropic viral integration site 5 protein homolog isoform X2 n=1 Tax=Hippocampus comes TaxID=109280 RepID=UPI00094E9858|nr:PREDICTED: ecotropic viral integration site 5 protein homolog isoform X2 [Hippocampus comes]
MLRTSSCADPKMSNDEDTFGSNAGSEVSPELQTDRFGFIVSNGSETRMVGPHPQLVRQREAKWINIMDQWQTIFLKKTNMVKVQCQKGIPSSLRARCWPLLCGATNRMNHNKQLFQSLDSQSALQKWVDIIDKDLDRQFPFHEMFLSKDGHGQQGLFRVLKAYTQYQPEEGYCQAQGPVAAVLLMNMPAEEAFWCLVQISEYYLPGYYSPLLRHAVEPLMFATDWLMCLFTRHLPFNALLRVWDLFFCNGVRVLLQVAVVLVRRVLGRAEQRKQCQGQMETLQRLRDVRCEVQKEDDTFIAEVCAVPLTSSDLEKHTEKELVKWRKDRPSSTFDPRRRCHGYRVAWERVQLNRAELDREERVTGNLSVPLARSASCLSLSPSLLHKRWRRGENDRVQKAVGGVSRHRSLGANDCRRCNEVNLHMTAEDKGVKKLKEDSDAKKQTVKMTGAMREMSHGTVAQNIPLAAEHASHQVPEDELLNDHIDECEDSIDKTQSQMESEPPEEVTLNINATKPESEVKSITKIDTVDEIATSKLQTRPELDQDKSIEAVNRQLNVVTVTDRSLSQGSASLCCQTESNNTTEQKQARRKIIPSLKQASVNVTPHLSGDICIRKSSTPRGSKLTRHLSEELFTDPGQSIRDAEPPKQTDHQTEPLEPAKHFSLFSRQPKKYTERGTAKIQVPTILIQDFSDGMEKLVVKEEEEANSRERRWWRRCERERREEKEGKLRKKKEIEVKKEKERERRKPQTRGKSFQVQRDTIKCSPSYAEAYF